MILANKFKDEFNQAVQTLSKPANSDLYAVEENLNSDLSFADGNIGYSLSGNLNFQ